MRKRIIFLLLAVLFVATACEKKGKMPENFKLYVNGVDNATPKKTGMRFLSQETAMSAKEVLKAMLRMGDTANVYYNGTDLCGVCNFKKVGEEEFTTNFSLQSSNIDTVAVRLVFIAGNLTTLEDNIFINPNVSYDLVITRWLFGYPDIVVDTIGYIPNAQREAAYARIHELWDDEDWNEMYEIFENGLQFIPCTGEQYRMLEAQGLN